MQLYFMTWVFGVKTASQWSSHCIPTIIDLGLRWEGGCGGGERERTPCCIQERNSILMDWIFLDLPQCWVCSRFHREQTLGGVSNCGQRRGSLAADVKVHFNKCEISLNKQAGVMWVLQPELCYPKTGLLNCSLGILELRRRGGRW